MDEPHRTVAALRLQRAVLPSVLGVCAAVLAWRGVVDLDLGWHLATGLWILDHRELPQLDPFGSQVRPWIAYSWLFDVAVAVIYRAAGFRGLQFLQLLLILSSLLSLLYATRTLGAAGSAAELVAVFGAVLLLSPFLYLRPQLVSGVLLLVFLVRLEQRRAGLLLVALLTALWSAIHVYWIAVPLLLLCYAFVDHHRTPAVSAAVAILVALGSGYGADTLTVLVDYLFDHAVATQIITEFQRLGPAHGIYFYSGMVGALAVVVLLWRKRQYLSLPLTLFCAAAALAGMYQIKYLLLVSVAFCLACAVEPQQLRRSAWGAGEVLLAALLGTGIGCATMFATFGLPATLTEKQQELIAILASLPEAPQISGALPAILNHFDDGGLVNFALYEHQKPWKSSIDGRTLVMGQKRLSQYRLVQQAAGESCTLVDEWGVQIAVLPQEDPLATRLTSSACATPWVQVLTCRFWQVLLQPQELTALDTETLHCSHR